MSGKSSKNIVGYKYRLGLHLILGHGPFDKIIEISSDRKVVWSGTNTGGPITFDKQELYGGRDREGGVSGTIDIEMGESTQDQNDYLVSKIGATISAFRGVTAAVFRQVYVGNNPYLKSWAFVGTRIHKSNEGGPQWYDAKAEVGSGQMNPAHIIRECLTNTEWGLGFTSTDIDDASFTAAANTLYSEGIGISILWTSSETIEDFMKNVLKHAEGVMFVDRNTGKFKIKLARYDYDVNTIPHLQTANIIEVKNTKISMGSELTSSVTIKFWDQSTKENNSYTLMDPALASSQGAPVNTTIEYDGITTAELAGKIAARDLRTLSTPLRSMTIYADRTAAGYNIGDVIKITWEPLGITQLIVRIGKIEIAAYGEEKVKLDVVEDVFATPLAIFTTPPSTGWVDPVNVPIAASNRSVVEASYWDLARHLGDNDAQALADDASFVMVTAASPTGDAISARLYSDFGTSGSAYTDTGSAEFCPYAQLASDITRTDTTISIVNTLDVDVVETPSYALIGTEVVSVTSVSETTLVCSRGCNHSVPQTHAAGTKIYFVDGYMFNDNKEYVAGETVRIKLLTQTGKGVLDIGLAPYDSVTFTALKDKPYPPGYVQVNSTYFPYYINGNVNASLTWRHRDRLSQTATLVPFTNSSNYGPEAGTEYRLEIYGETNNLLRTEYPLTGTDYTYSLATEGTDSAFGGLRPNASLRFVLFSTRDGYESAQKHDFTVKRAMIVIDRDLTAPPGSSTTGNTYIVAAGATGDWAGQVNNLVIWNGSSWTFYTPSTGWVANIQDEGNLIVEFNGSAWV